ncbi:PH domain-containing protein [Thalassobellus sediminis]|uniref:PH domain-containing protein n=1 Tax=Thalassobellus sediminis TaxID=3367753 RepID=UPI00378C8E40
MKFKSRKDIIIHFLALGFGLISVFFISRIFSVGIENYDFTPAEIILFLSTSYILWLYFGTEYELTSKEFIYKSGPIRGKVNIENISEIITNKNVWAGIRPALSINGMLIKFNKYDDIFISTKNSEKFIEKILEINNEIKITRN